MTKKELALEWYWKNLSTKAPVTMLTEPAKYPPDPIDAFIAGYEAKEIEDRLRFADLHAHGSEPQQIAAAWVKQRGTAHPLALIEEAAFINGYLIAKQEK